MPKGRLPRATLRKLITSQQPGFKLRKEADVLIHLNYLLFLKSLASEAGIEALNEKSRMITDKEIRAALPRVLRSFKG